MKAHERKCWDCGNIAVHEDNVTPWVCCSMCGSRDTRPRPVPAIHPAETVLRSEIESVIEEGAGILHDATSWWADETQGPRLIDTLCGMIVVAAKKYAREVGNGGAI